MKDSRNFIPPEVVEKIQGAGDLLDVIQDFVQLTKKGRAEWLGECMKCHDPKGLHVPTAKSKRLYKCVKCDDGGKYPLQFLQNQVGKPYREALVYMADRYNIDIAQTDPPKATRGKKKAPGKKATARLKQLTFCEQQLAASGIPVESQRFSLWVGQNEHPDNYRYEKGKINSLGEVDRSGDDMILHYLDLHGNPLEFINSRRKKQILYRVRHKNPYLPDNLDKSGKPKKYSSPYGSGSHLWLPNFILKAYKSKQTFKHLYIIEGEKKADSLCLQGIPTVGVMGIHNLATERMPAEFQDLINVFECTSVVFLLDSDYQDLAIHQDKSVDQRPKSFYRAVINFKEFFVAFTRMGMDIRILFGSHKDEDHKGVDDLLMSKPGYQKKICDDLIKAVNNQSHQGEFWQLTDVTSMSDYKLQEHWHLHSDVAFLDKHKSQLKDLGMFKKGKFKWKYIDDQTGFEMDRKLLPHEQFWIEYVNKSGKLCFEFDYLQIENFCKNRGVGNFMIHPDDDESSLINIDGKQVETIDPRFIQLYTIEFVKTLDTPNWKDIARFMKKGISQYLGHVQTSLLPEVKPLFKEAQRDSQELIFENCTVQMTADGITVTPEASFNFWKDRVIPFEFKKREKPLFELSRDGSEQWTIQINEGGSCEIFNFLYRTSCTYWRKMFDLTKDSEGVPLYKRKKGSLTDLGVTDEEQSESLDHFASKVLAIGYLVHDFIDKSQTKAIMCMDLKESERGAAEGGSGKSIFAKILDYIVPTFEVDAASPDLSQDKFFMEGVSQSTQVILLDDVRDDFDFRVLFSKITSPVKVQRKSKTTINVGYKKWLITMNGTIRGNSYSFRRRQYLLGFTDYYNENRTPFDEMGHNMFDEWPNDQWQMFYNFVSQCVVTYLNYGLAFTIPKAQILRRRYRDDLGENFLDWCEERFSSDGEWINNEINKLYLMDDFIREYPNQRKYINVKKMKDKLKIYAIYSGLDFNIQKDGERIKSGSKEYFCLSNGSFSASQCMKIDKHDTGFANDRFEP